MRHALIVAAACLALPSAAFGAGDLTVEIQGGAGHVTGDPMGVKGDPIDCAEPEWTPGGDVCQARYEDDELCLPDRPCQKIPWQAVLDAAPTVSGWAFDHWVGCDDPWKPRCTVLMDRDRTVTAVYRDTEPPFVEITAPGAGPVRGVIAFTATATDNWYVDHLEFGAPGFNRTDPTAPWSTALDTTKLPDGRAYLWVRAFDPAGNVRSSTVEVTVDNTAPVVTFTGGPADGATLAPGTSQTWTFESSDPVTGVAAVECSVAPDGAAPAWGPCSGAGAHTVSGLSLGTYVIAVRATDRVGNEQVASRRFAIAEPRPPASPAPPAVSGPDAPPAAPPAGPALPARVAALLARSLRDAEADRRLRRVLVPVTCPAQQRRACEGTLSAETRERYRTRSGRRARLRLRARRFEVAQGDTALVALTLPAAVRSRLKRGRSVRLLVRVSERDASGRLRHGARRTVRVVALPGALRATRGRSVRVQLLFPVGADPRGEARVELTRGGRPAAAARSVAPRPGRTVRATLRLSRSTARLLARRGSVRLTLRLTYRDADGRAQVRRRTLTVRR